MSTGTTYKTSTKIPMDAAERDFTTFLSKEDI